MKYAVGAILVGPDGGREEVRVDLIEAESPEHALGIFFRKFCDQDVMIRNFSIKGDRGRTAEIEPEIVDCLKRGRKIEAIKLRRELTGEGLREAKDWVERVAIPTLEKEGVLKKDEDEDEAPF